MAKNMIKVKPLALTGGSGGGQGRLEKSADAAKSKVKIK
jgi:hypothetical protein